MDLYHCMQTFTEVVEQQSFAKAAKKRFRSPPQVSKEISWLEEELDIQLLTRTTRKLSLTEAGESFYNYAKKALDDYWATKKEIQSGKQEISGKLQVTLPLSFLETVFLDLPEKFLAAYPDIKLELLASNELVDLVEQRIDLAIRVKKFVLPSYESEDFCRVQRGLYASPAYLKTHSPIKHPDGLMSQSCILHAKSKPNNQWVFKDNYSLTISPVYICNSVVSMVEAAKKGLGYVYLTKHNIISELEKGELVEVLPEYVGEFIDVAICYPKSEFVPIKVQKFIEFVKEHYSDAFK